MRLSHPITWSGVSMPPGSKRRDFERLRSGTGLVQYAGMRVSVLIFVLTLATAASAEKVKTNQSTKVYSRPGEQAKVVLTLKSGQNMTLLAQDGRWLKVRVQGRTGYVPRSKVDMPDGEEIVRNTRRRAFVDGRSTRRGFGGES